MTNPRIIPLLQTALEHDTIVVDCGRLKKSALTSELTREIAILTASQIDANE
jgi:hypothetical protein